MISIVSDLLNCIVCVTAFMHLLDMVHGVLLDLEVPQYRSMTVLKSYSRIFGFDYFKRYVAVTQTTYNYSVNMYYIILPILWAT